MAGIYDKIKHFMKSGVLSKQWKAAKKNAETLKFPKKDFGTELDSFENSAKKAHALLAEIKKLIEKLNKEKQKFYLYSEAALSTGKLYKKVASEAVEGTEPVEGAESVVTELEGIISTLEQPQEEVKAIPVPTLPEPS